MGRPEVPIAELLTRYIPIPEAGCWIWEKGCNKAGYGRLTRQKKPLDAHRFFYENMVGPVPDGMEVCHRCDTPSCVNPAHLFLGTSSQNTQDMLLKGRGPVGEKGSAAKLKLHEVHQIRDLLSVFTQKQVGAMYGIQQSSVSLIKRGINWKGL